MEFAMMIISNDKTVGSYTVQVLKDLNSQFLATEAKKMKTISFNDTCY